MRILTIYVWTRRRRNWINFALITRRSVRNVMMISSLLSAKSNVEPRLASVREIQRVIVTKCRRSVTSVLINGKTACVQRE